MPAAGQLTQRCRFERRAIVNGDLGDAPGDDWMLVATVWGGLSMQRARETVAQGQIGASAAGVLTVRRSRLTESLTPDDRVVIKGVTYNIRGIIDPAERGEMLEMTVERGVA